MTSAVVFILLLGTILVSGKSVDKREEPQGAFDIDRATTIFGAFWGGKCVSTNMGCLATVSDCVDHHCSPKVFMWVLLGVVPALCVGACLLCCCCGCCPWVFALCCACCDGDSEEEEVESSERVSTMTSTKAPTEPIKLISERDSTMAAIKPSVEPIKLASSKPSASTANLASSKSSAEPMKYKLAPSKTAAEPSKHVSERANNKAAAMGYQGTTKDSMNNTNDAAKLNKKTS